MEEKIIQNLKKIISIPEIEEQKDILCILPHPDDGEIGAGATLAKLKDRGATIKYVVVTDGSAGIRGKSREETKKIRKEEQEKAAGILGINEIIWLNYPDNGKYNIHDVKEALKKIIKDIQPDIVFTVDPFLPYETHSDHIICGLAASQAILNSGFSSTLLAFFFTAYPNQFVCVDSYWDKKFEAVKEHKSQISEEALSIYKQYFSLKAGVYGEKIGCEYAEHFKVLLPIMLHSFEEALWV